MKFTQTLLLLAGLVATGLNGVNLNPLTWYVVSTPSDSVVEEIKAAKSIAEIDMAIDKLSSCDKWSVNGKDLHTTIQTVVTDAKRKLNTEISKKQEALKQENITAADKANLEKEIKVLEGVYPFKTKVYNNIVSRKSVYAGVTAGLGYAGYKAYNKYADVINPVVKQGVEYAKPVFEKGKAFVEFVKPYLKYAGITAGVQGVLGLGYLVYKNWETVKNATVNTGKTVGNKTLNGLTTVKDIAVAHPYKTAAGFVGAVGTGAFGYFYGKTTYNKALDLVKAGYGKVADYLSKK